LVIEKYCVDQYQCQNGPACYRERGYDTANDFHRFTRRLLILTFLIFLRSPRSCIRIPLRGIPLSAFAGAILISETPYKFRLCTSSMLRNRFPIAGGFAIGGVQF